MYHKQTSNSLLSIQKRQLAFMIPQCSEYSIIL